MSKKAAKTLEKLDTKTKMRIKAKLKQFAEDPFSQDIKRLVGSRDPPLYRIRVGDYRIIFWVDWEKRRVYVERIFHRSDGYNIFFE